MGESKSRINAQQWRVNSRAGAMQIFLRTLTGGAVVVDLPTQASTDVLKTRVEDLEGIPTCEQRLLFAGKQLEDGQNLADCLSEGDTVRLCLTIEGGGKKKKKK